MNIVLWMLSPAAALVVVFLWLAGTITCSSYEDTPSHVASLQIAHLADAIALFEARHGRSPTEDEGLYVLAALYRGHSPLVERLSVDPWGSAYGYRLDVDGRGRVASRGPDRRFGTLDDVDPYGVIPMPRFGPAPSPTTDRGLRYLLCLGLVFFIGLRTFRGARAIWPEGGRVSLAEV